MSSSWFLVHETRDGLDVEMGEGEMTKKAILAMKAGRQLNIKVAKEVMWQEVISDAFFGDMEKYVDRQGGNVYGPLPAYSQDKSAAQLVVEKMLKLGLGGRRFWEYYRDGTYERAEAICKAALLVMLGKRNGNGGKPDDE